MLQIAFKHCLILGTEVGEGSCVRELGDFQDAPEEGRKLRGLVAGVGH